MEIISIAIIALSVLVGYIITSKTKTIDSPAEQAIEHVLRQKGLDVDFSSEKKRKLAEEKTNKNLKNQKETSPCWIVTSCGSGWPACWH